MLNQVLVKCRIDDIKKYLGKQIKGIINGKEVVLYIRLLCDEFDIMDGLDLIKNNDNILLLDYIGSDFSPIYMTLSSEVVGDNYVIKLTDVENELTEKYVESIVKETPSGIVPVLRLPEKFKDLELIYNLNQKYPRVRFCGGTLFVIDGCNIGCCGMDLLQKKGVQYDLDAYYRKGTCDCALEVHDFKEIRDITVIVNNQQVNDIEQKKVEQGKQISFADLLSGNFV